MPHAPQYARLFHIHRAALLELLAGFPEEHAHFKPWDGALSFVGLADHLAESSRRIVGLTQEIAPGPAPAPSATLAEALSRLQESSHTVMTTVPTLSDEDLARVVPGVRGLRMPIQDLLGLLVTHEAHHKGQIWTMSRMVGVNPGLYVKLG